MSSSVRCNRYEKCNALQGPTQEVWCFRLYGKRGNRGSIAGMNSGRERIPRRLAAILAADVAGYSRLMGADEEGTHAALTALRREVSDPKIAEHRGRLC